MEPKPRRRRGNLISYLGAIIALVSFLLIVIMLIATAFGPPPSPYTGILVYFVGPLVLIIGLILIPIGYWLASRRARKAGVPEGEDTPPEYPRLDLNKPRTRRNVALFTVATLFIMALLGGATYGAVEYMDSTEFCGELCHTVMEPEYVAYQSSPHTRVNCVNCHIGPGAPGFVQAKLSGVRQLVAVTFNTYSKPIPVPVKELRPARETCERCHWPAKFVGDKIVTRTTFADNEQNDRQDVAFTIATGGGGEQHGIGFGVHWHADEQINVEYIATDEQRQSIPWVRVTTPDGQVRTYVDKTKPLTEEEVARSEVRRMDCVDCHNRPTHIYERIDQAVDSRMALGKIKPDLPFIKREGMRVLSVQSPSKDKALSYIESSIIGFYRDNYPQVYNDRRDDIAAAVASLQDAYSRNVFPQMNVTWGTYKSNIGHQVSLGCFRCHDGNHATQQGEPIRNECGTCHTLPQPIPPVQTGPGVGPTPPIEPSTTPAAGAQ